LLLADAQNFIVRRYGVLVKKGLIKRERLNLYYPRSRLHFGNWLPEAAYKDVFVKNHYDGPISLGPGARIIDGGANIGLSSCIFCIGTRVHMWMRLKPTPLPARFFLIRSVG